MICLKLLENQSDAGTIYPASAIEYSQKFLSVQCDKSKNFMGLLDDCELLFGTNNLYELLNVAKECKESDIKKAYRKLSLQVHPDRASADEQEHATKKFQVSSSRFLCSLAC